MILASVIPMIILSQSLWLYRYRTTKN